MAFIELHMENGNGFILLNAEDIGAVTVCDGRTALFMSSVSGGVKLFVRENYDEVRKMLCGGSSGQEKDGESGWGSK